MICLRITGVLSHKLRNSTRYRESHRLLRTRLPLHTRLSSNTIVSSLAAGRPIYCDRTYLYILSVKPGSVWGEWIRVLFVKYIRGDNFQAYVYIFHLWSNLLLNGTNFRPIFCVCMRQNWQRQYHAAVKITSMKVLTLIDSNGYMCLWRYKYCRFIALKIIFLVQLCLLF